MPFPVSYAMVAPMQKLPDLTPVFERYETVAREADAVFSRIKGEHSTCVTCHEGCSDCCHALFDLPLIEAAYLNDAFLKAFPSGAERSRVLERAHAADREVHRIKRKAFKASQAGEDVQAILTDLAAKRVRCPLLGDDGKCVLYACRPVTCRLYGVPTAIGGKGHVCGKSAFLPGKAYPTVNMDKIHERLLALSKDLAAHAASEYAEIHTVLVPVSMALITSYDAKYFGIGRKAGGRNG